MNRFYSLTALECLRTMTNFYKEVKKVKFIDYNTHSWNMFRWTTN